MRTERRKRKGISRCLSLFLLLFAVSFCAFPVKAEDAEGADSTAAGEEEIQEETEKLMEEFEFGEIDQVLKEIMPEEKLNFGETVLALIKGDEKLSVQLLSDLLTDRFFYEFQTSREGMVHILLIAVIAAVFTNFSSVFQNRQIGEISFYVLYMLLLTICLTSFQVVLDSAGESIGNLIVFMRALGPAYFLAVAVAAGSSTSVMFYNLALLLIYMVELLILNFLLPLLHIYMVVKVLNYISAEDYLSRFAELIEFVIGWVTKTLLAAVIGLNVIQGLITPAVDSLKRGIVSRGVEALPVVGDALSGVTGTLLGTAVLVKNGIGAAGAVICIAICAVPVLQLLVMTFLYKLLAALVQPVSDKRIVGCIGCMGEGSQLLVRIVFTTGVLFLLTIAIVTATTT